MSVYFAQVGHYIKIGYSENPERRVRRLFSSDTRYGAPEDCPRDLASRHLIRAIDGTKDDEGRIHRALDDFCVGLEWYVDEPALREYIATVEQTEGEYPVLVREEGPAFVAYDEERDLTPAEYDQLRAALASMFTQTPADEGIPRSSSAA